MLVDYKFVIMPMSEKYRLDKVFRLRFEVVKIHRGHVVIIIPFNADNRRGRTAAILAPIKPIRGHLHCTTFGGGIQVAK
jgi:hypothetical protein